jgi:hypothetical protein
MSIVKISNAQFMQNMNVEFRNNRKDHNNNELEIKRTTINNKYEKFI